MVGGYIEGTLVVGDEGWRRSAPSVSLSSLFLLGAWSLGVGTSVMVNGGGRCLCPPRTRLVPTARCPYAVPFCCPLLSLIAVLFWKVNSTLL